MLSAKLIRLIEEHWESIASRVIREIRHDPRMPHIARLPESELREWGEKVLRNMDHWFTARGEHEVAERYERLGRQRFEESVPLGESVCALFLLKERMLDFIRDEGIGQNAVDLYAEEELEHHVGRFFDSLIYHLVHGYEDAMRRAAQMVV